MSVNHNIEVEVMIDGEWNALGIPSPRGLKTRPLLGFKNYYEVSRDDFNSEYLVYRPKPLEGLPDDLSTGLKNKIESDIREHAHRFTSKSKTDDKAIEEGREKLKELIENSFTYYTLSELKEIDLNEKIPVEEFSEGCFPFAIETLKQDNKTLKSAPVYDIKTRVRKALKNGGSTQVKIVRYELEFENEENRSSWVLLSEWDEKKEQFDHYSRKNIRKKNVEKADYDVEVQNKDRIYGGLKEFRNKLEKIRECIDGRSSSKEKTDIVYTRVEDREVVEKTIKKPDSEFINRAPVDDEDIRVCIWQHSNLY